MELDDIEFFRRFMLHVLPKGFMKIRHYGFLGIQNKEDRMTLLRAATKTANPLPLKIIPEMIISKIIKETLPSALPADRNVTINWNNPTNSKVTSPMRFIG